MKRPTNSIEAFCETYCACPEGRAWALANCKDMAEAWDKAKPDWLLWIATREGVLDNRTLRLFACWCARRVWHLLADERIRNAVEVAERYASGEATDAELAEASAAARAAASAKASAAARAAVWAVASDTARAKARAAASAAAWAVASDAASAAASDVALSAAWYAASAAAWDAAWDAALDAQAAHLRDTVANPFKARVTRRAG